MRYSSIFVPLLLSLLPIASMGASAPAFTTTDHGLLHNGEPFFWQGDTAWLLMTLTPADVEYYLDDRAARGFNVIQMMAIRTDHTRASPTTADLVANYAGHKPFTGTDPVTLDENYWRHIDFIVNAADERNLVVALATMWGRDADSLFPDPMVGNRRYGRLLASRYRHRENVIWLVTGEYGKINDNWRRSRKLTAEQLAMLRAIADGLETGHAGRHLMTIHPIYSSSDDFHNDKWLDFNMQQTWGHENPNITRIGADYRRSPPKPVLNGEPGYENRPEPPTSTAWKCRYEGYWSVFSGAFGYTYGAHGLWQFNPDWKDALKYEGADDMQHLRRLIESRPMAARIPDQSILAPADRDLKKTRSYTAATRAADGGYAMIYSTKGDPFTVDLKAVKGPSINAWWYNPRDGRCYNQSNQRTDTPFKTIDNKRPQEFTPPTSGPDNDWVLILDKAEGQYPAPGATGP